MIGNASRLLQRGILGLGFVLALESTGCATEDAVTGVFAGRAGTSTTYVAVVTDGKQVVAYVCDGATVAQWFAGSTDPESIQLSANGASFTASLDASGGTGKVVLADGRQLTFALSRVGQDAGLYRATLTSNGTSFVGGWIVLGDGTQRGAISSKTTVVSTQPLDVKTMSANVSGVGTLQATRLTPTSVQIQLGQQFGMGG